MFLVPPVKNRANEGLAETSVSAFKPDVCWTWRTVGKACQDDETGDEPNVVVPGTAKTTKTAKTDWRSCLIWLSGIASRVHELINACARQSWKLLQLAAHRTCVYLTTCCVPRNVFTPGVEGGYLPSSPRHRLWLTETGR